MINSLRNLIAFCLVSLSSFGQTTEHTDYHPPLAIPQVLASNFGELRPNHFHMGIDFKTNGRIGYNLYSIEEGFVSRIKVSPYGYGKVVYIDHPNGVTSVYAHCSEFKGQLDSIVKVTQLKEENFEVEIFPAKNEITVSKGQIIAISGNTGGSTAPHLHFELRDTESEAALNPLLYGFDIADTRKPEIRGVKIYALTKDGYRFENKTIKRTAIKSGGKYTVSNNSITIPSSFLSKSGGIGFAFDVIDRLDGANNTCGLYGSVLTVNGDTLFGQETRKVPFESTRFVNSHKDYSEYALNRKKYHKSFRTKENNLPIYTVKDLGILQGKPGDKFKVKYIAYDPQGNTSVMAFNVTISAGELNPKDSIAQDLSWLQPSESMLVEHNDTHVDFDLCTTYEPIKIDGNSIDTKVGDRNIPVQTPYQINIKHDGPKDGKHYIEMITAKGRKKALKIEYSGRLITCESKFFGSYKLKRDTIAPTITPLNIPSITTRKKLNWRISDNASGIADYDLYIDGKWHLIEYEYKNGQITFTRENSLKGTKNLVVKVKDQCGNIKEWKKTVTFN
ncbi:MAG: M23 family metallopeptidase [Crocinitomicaceae bacterium]|nr:M23 family metallopeptidase [Crocinitomicaceae bacterium]